MNVETIGKYEIRGRLGAGSMGQVLDAFDLAIERRVALKLLLKPAPDDVEGIKSFARFKREAQTAGRLNHPNLVAVYDYGEDATRAWIAMELVQGGTLQQVLDRGERLSVPQVLRLMEQVLAGLNYSHKHGVVHRDIKPANIMLTEYGMAKLADFGIARIENSSITTLGTVIGTPSYMAPEQLRGETVDGRADIWACGVLLYQLLTGEKPFEGGFSALLHKALHTEPPLPSSLSSTTPCGMDLVVVRALAKRPEDRFATAAEFAAALQEATAATATPTIALANADATVLAVPRPSASPMPLAAKSSRRLMAPLLGGLIVATAGVVAIILLETHRGNPPSTLEEVAFAQPPALGPSSDAPVPQRQRVDFRAAAAALAATPACALLAVSGTDSSLTLEGVVQASDAVALQRVLAQHNIPPAAAQLTLQTFEGPYCSVLDLLRPVLAAADVAPRVAVSDATPLRAGAFLRFQVVMPEWSRLLHAVYLTPSGEVFHLVQSTSHQPGATVQLGEWEVTEPFGTDLLLVFVSDHPLFPSARPEIESQSTYLAAMSDAIRRTQQAGRRVEVRPLVVETADR